MTTNNFKLSKFSLQEYLSLGYIYLVLLGIISDVVYFKFLGVNILNYTTLLDVLITPINIIVHDLKVLGSFALFITFSYVLMYHLLPRFHAKNNSKEWYKKIFGDQNENVEIKKNNSGILLFAVLIFSMFIGFGIGRGSKTKRKIDKGVIENNDKIIFNNGKTKSVIIVGQNSLYVFYISKNEKEVTICPITQNIREIKKISME